MVVTWWMSVILDLFQDLNIPRAQNPAYRMHATALRGRFYASVPHAKTPRIRGVQAYFLLKNSGGGPDLTASVSLISPALIIACSMRVTWLFRFTRSPRSW